MKDLGDLHYFLDIQIHHTATSMPLCQSKYIGDIPTRTKMDGAKPLSSPAVTRSKLSIHDGYPLHNPTSYISIVGALQYLTATRPDIAFAVNQCVSLCMYPRLHIELHSKELCAILKA